MTDDDTTKSLGAATGSVASRRSLQADPLSALPAAEATFGVDPYKINLQGEFAVCPAWVPDVVFSSPRQSAPNAASPATRTPRSGPHLRMQRDDLYKSAISKASRQ
jgi:hypothetical protein